MTTAMASSIFRTCTLCEAGCGLRFEVEDNRIRSVRADPDDVLSRGYVCPKGIAIAEVQDDPDRLKTPVRRTPSGRFEPISWDNAFDLAATRLRDCRDRYGRDAIAVYYGNPTVYDHGATLMVNPFIDAIGTRNRFSANSQDINPRLVTSYHLYGASWSVPVADVDRTHYFLCVGANPLVSNGSLLTAPNLRERIRTVRERGGKVVVVDPRRTETADVADEHVAIRPGGDAALLLGMVRVLLDAGRIDRARLEKISSGWETVESKLRAFTPLRAAQWSGVEPGTIERLALEFADAPSAVAYSRMGVCGSPFATLATYANDLLNLVAGRLGQEGGALFTTPAIDVSTFARLSGVDGFNRWRSRVRGLPETIGDLPSSVLAEEIETPGDGQVRAFVTVAGNPVLSTPNGRRLSAALETLEFMCSIDLYVNETTRHADLILPSAWSLIDDHVDIVFPLFSCRNVVRWSPPVLERGENERTDWEILLELTERLGGGPMGMEWLDRGLRLARHVGYRWHPSSIAGLLLRIGAHGDRFLPWSRGLNLKKLKAAPHGIDLGPLEPGFEQRISHRDRRIHLDPKPILESMDDLSRQLETAKRDELVLIGRREVRTNNSWMHNLPSLVSGRERCVLLVHPEDAAKAGVSDGDTAILETRVHRGQVRVRVTNEMMRGVLSLPHGWGHAESAPWQQVAGKHAGVSANDWTDDQVVEPVVGQSILNGVPARLRPIQEEKSR
jgi:anaerobic selenocysteine-containing dehydrogenase